MLLDTPLPGHLEVLSGTPRGPISYGWWDSVPGRPEARQTHAKWLKRYSPLVEEGTRAYLEITDSDFFAAPLPKGVTASAFANKDLYIVLANYTQTAVEVEMAGSGSPVGEERQARGNHWRIPSRSARIFLMA